MTHISYLNTTHAKTQQEVFAQLENAGRRFPVVFSHVHFNFSLYNNNLRKGANTQLSHSSPDGSPRRLSTNTNPGGQQISFLSFGRPASVSTKPTNNSFFTLSFNRP